MRSHFPSTFPQSLAARLESTLTSNMPQTTQQQPRSSFDQRVLFALTVLITVVCIFLQGYANREDVRDKRGVMTADQNLALGASIALGATVAASSLCRVIKWHRNTAMDLCVGPTVLAGGVSTGAVGAWMWGEDEWEYVRSKFGTGRGFVDDEL